VKLLLSRKRPFCLVSSGIMLGDIQSKRLLYIKGVLLLLTGVLASVILLIRSPSILNALLICIATWGFCRAYYFVFYVIEHYADRGYKFAGLGSFLRYAWKRGGTGKR